MFETVEQEDLETVGNKDLETVGQEDSYPPAPPIRSQRKSGPTSCYVGNRAQEREKENNVAVRRLTKGYRQQVGDGGSKRKINAREVEGGGSEKGVKAGGG